MNLQEAMEKMRELDVAEDKDVRDNKEPQKELQL